MDERPRGIGGIVTTQVERVALGTHRGHDLHARVQRRALRLRAGDQWHLDLGLGRTRPVAIEVGGPAGRYDLTVVTADPWWRLVRRVGTVAAIATAVVVLAGRIRRTPSR